MRNIRKMQGVKMNEIAFQGKNVLCNETKIKIMLYFLEKVFWGCILENRKV